MSPEEQNLVPISSVDFSNKSEDLMIVLGSEGEGVSQIIGKMADSQVILPPRLDMDMINQPPFDMVDSLNVGVSAATILYHI